MKEERKLQFY